MKLLQMGGGTSRRQGAAAASSTPTRATAVVPAAAAASEAVTTTTTAPPTRSLWTDGVADLAGADLADAGGDEHHDPDPEDPPCLFGAAATSATVGQGCVAVLWRNLRIGEAEDAECVWFGRGDAAGHRVSITTPGSRTVVVWGAVGAAGDVATSP
jgi:hypothetical protein